MRPETRSPSNQPEKATPPMPSLPAAVPALSGKNARVGTTSSGAGSTPAPGTTAAPEAYSLTARMNEYRSWWNLPRSKTRKSRP